MSEEEDAVTEKTDATPTCRACRPRGDPARIQVRVRDHRGTAFRGKSTLLNRLVGEKIAITSDKPQTTRNRILGYVNRPNGQLAFIDTPGLIKPYLAMHTRMMSVAHSAIGEAMW